MLNKDKIRNIIELFIAWNGETEPIDVANIDSAVEFISNSLQEKNVSEDLKKAVKIARVEVITKSAKWLKDNIDDFFSDKNRFIREYQKAMKDE